MARDVRLSLILTANAISKYHDKKELEENLEKIESTLVGEITSDYRLENRKTIIIGSNSINSYRKYEQEVLKNTVEILAKGLKGLEVYYVPVSSLVSEVEKIGPVLGRSRDSMKKIEFVDRRTGELTIGVARNYLGLIGPKLLEEHTPFASVMDDGMTRVEPWKISYEEILKKFSEKYNLKELKGLLDYIELKDTAKRWLKRKMLTYTENLMAKPVENTHILYTALVGLPDLENERGKTGYGKYMGRAERQRRIEDIRKNLIDEKRGYRERAYELLYDSGFLPLLLPVVPPYIIIDRLVKNKVAKRQIGYMKKNFFIGGRHLAPVNNEIKTTYVLQIPFSCNEDFQIFGMTLPTDIIIYSSNPKRLRNKISKENSWNRHKRARGLNQCDYALDFARLLLEEYFNAIIEDEITGKEDPVDRLKIFGERLYRHLHNGYPNWKRERLWYFADFLMNYIEISKAVREAVDSGYIDLYPLHNSNL